MNIVTCICFCVRFLMAIVIFSVPLRLFQTRYPKVQAVLGFALIGLIPAWLKMIYQDNDNAFAVLTVFVFFLYVAWYLWVLTGTLKKRILALIIFPTLEASVDMCVHLIFTGIMDLKTDFSWQSPSMLIPVLMMFPVYAVFVTLIIKVWKHVLGDREQTQKPELVLPWYYYLILTMFLGSETIFIVMRSLSLQQRAEIAIAAELAGTLLGILTNFLMLNEAAVAMRQMELKKNLYYLKVQQRREVQRYQMLLREIEEIARMRHDYQNHLTTVNALVEEQKDSGELLRNLLKRIKE